MLHPQHWRLVRFAFVLWRSFSGHRDRAWVTGGECVETGSSSSSGSTATRQALIRRFGSGSAGCRARPGWRRLAGGGERMVTAPMTATRLGDDADDDEDDDARRRRQTGVLATMQH